MLTDNETHRPQITDREQAWWPVGVLAKVVDSATYFGLRPCFDSQTVGL